METKGKKPKKKKASAPVYTTKVIIIEEGPNIVFKTESDNPSYGRFELLGKLELYKHSLLNEFKPNA